VADIEPKAEFYRRGKIENVISAQQLESIKSQFSHYFQTGKRYHLCTKLMSKVERRESIIELGCGLGESLGYLAMNYGFGKATGFDIGFSKSTSFSHGKTEFTFSSVDLDRPLPIESSSVDCLVAMMIYEHLFDPFKSFQEIVRVLHHDGLAFVNLPLVTNLRNRFRLAAGYLPTTSVPTDRWFQDESWDGNHLHYFSVSMIQKLCQHVGLEVVSMAGVGRWSGLKSIFPSILAGELTFACRKRRA